MAKKTTEQKLEDAELEIKRLSEWGDNLEGRIRGYKNGIVTLKEELKEAVEEADFQKGIAADIGTLNQRQEKRLRKANDFLCSIRRGIIRTWEHNDLLREQLVGSYKMPNGRTFREHTRDEFLRLSFEYSCGEGVTEGSAGEESPRSPD